MTCSSPGQAPVAEEAIRSDDCCGRCGRCGRCGQPGSTHAECLFTSSSGRFSIDDPAKCVNSLRYRLDRCYWVGKSKIARRPGGMVSLYLLRDAFSRFLLSMEWPMIVAGQAVRHRSGGSPLCWIDLCRQPRARFGGAGLLVVHSVPDRPTRHRGASPSPGAVEIGPAPDVANLSSGRIGSIVVPDADRSSPGDGIRDDHREDP